MGKAGLYFNTIIRLSGKQVLYQCLRRFNGKLRSLFGIKYKFSHYKEGNLLHLKQVVLKYETLKDGVFTFINLPAEFNGEWENKELGPLWSFNINYMDYLLQPSMGAEEGKKWIFRFIETEKNNKVGMAPYCISLRFVNWVKFLSINKKSFSVEEKRVVDTSLYSQYRILDRNLEYNLAGNHLLENIFTLLWAAYYFDDKTIFRKASRLLKRELEKQTLPGGANYEQSPMYHCIILDRVLDAVNLLQNNGRFEGDKELLAFLREKAGLMLGWLQYICYEDGSYPLFNDSAKEIAPLPSALFDYASRLGIRGEASVDKAAGYYAARGSNYELRMDVGGIAASYIPGHSHADTFNFELRVGGKPFIVDTGISNYNICERRFYERSTAAHNTVVVNGEDSSRVWSAFRCAQRAEVVAVDEGDGSITATHNGYRKRGVMHTRSFSWEKERVTVKDKLTRNVQAVAYLHFAIGVDVSLKDNTLSTPYADIIFSGAKNIEICAGEYSTEYNRFKKCVVTAVTFEGELTTIVTVR